MMPYEIPCTWRGRKGAKGGEVEGEGVDIDPQKSQLACFGGNSPRDNIITLGDIYLSWSAQIKYLGCCFRGKQCAVDPSSFIGGF